MIIYELPISVTLERKTKPDREIMLNINNYRNWQFHLNNQLKQAFEPISGQGFSANKICISYQVEKRTKRKYDTMNIVSIVDKFFLDWLVKTGCLLDDNCNVVSYGSIEGRNDCEADRVIAKIEIIE